DARAVGRAGAGDRHGARVVPARDPARPPRGRADRVPVPPGGRRPAVRDRVVGPLRRPPVGPAVHAAAAGQGDPAEPVGGDLPAADPRPRRQAPLRRAHRHAPGHRLTAPGVAARGAGYARSQVPVDGRALQARPREVHAVMAQRDFEQQPEAPDLGASVQLETEQTLASPPGGADPLDAGYSPPDRPYLAEEDAVTARGMREGESLDERLDRERGDDPVGDPVGDPVDADRSGRIAMAGEGAALETPDAVDAVDVGVDGGAAGAEEAAVHTTEDPDA